MIVNYKLYYNCMLKIYLTLFINFSKNIDKKNSMTPEQKLHNKDALFYSMGIE